MYRVEVVSQPDGSMKAQSKDAAFIVDTKGRGITPPDTLLASLAGCVGVYLRKYAEGAKLRPLKKPFFNGLNPEERR